MASVRRHAFDRHRPRGATKKIANPCKAARQQEQGGEDQLLAGIGNLAHGQASNTKVMELTSLSTLPGCPRYPR